MMTKGAKLQAQLRGPMDPNEMQYLKPIFGPLDAN